MKTAWTERTLPWISGLAAAGVLVWLLAPVLTPFAIALFLAWLGGPLVYRLEARRVPRTAAVVLVFLLILSALSTAVLLLAPIIGEQLRLLVTALPDAAERLKAFATDHAGRHSETITAWLDPERLRALAAEHWRDAGAVVGGLLGMATRSGSAITTFLLTLVLVPVLTFYFLRDWDGILDRLSGLVPPRHLDTVKRLANESDAVLTTFFKGQFLVMLSLAAIYSTGLWIAGLELALLVGVIAGLVSFIPYLGLIVGLLTAGAAVLFQTGDFMQLLLVAAVFGVGQVLESVLLTPRLVGERIGLHPVMVLFSIMAGGQLFGFLGILLALPVTAVLAVLARHMAAQWQSSALYRGDGAT